MNLSRRISFALASVSFATLTASPYAAAADGTVNFTGAILDTPCTIAPSDQRVAVDLGNVSVGAVLANTMDAVGFSIKLSNCARVIKQNAQVTFTGQSTGNGLLALTSGTDTAKGVAIELSQDGKMLPVGQKSTLVNIQNGNTPLPFAARYVNYGGVIPSAGKANATAQFTVSYQ